jgi:hypothetical protein
MAREPSMPHATRLVTSSVLALGLAAPLAADAQASSRVTRLTVQQRMVIRVPRMAPAQVALPKPVKWKERNGPKCIGAQTLAGALISAPRQVDLVLIGGKRLRAKLDGDCRPLDFYTGFYLRPSKDGMICRDRDAIFVRSGASCRIDDFKQLQASKP